MKRTLDDFWKCHLDQNSFGRHPDVEVEYRIHAKICTDFGFTGGSEYAQLFYGDSVLGITFASNRFPYLMQPKFAHYVAWIHPKHTHTWTIERVKDYILENHAFEKFIIFENPKNLQSLKNVKHFHIIAKR